MPLKILWTGYMLADSRLSLMDASKGSPHRYACRHRGWRMLPSVATSGISNSQQKPNRPLAFSAVFLAN